MRLSKALPILALVIAGTSLGEETRIHPRYPSAAIRQCLSGEVKLELTFGDGGAVERVVVLESTPKGIFDESAVQAARQLRLDPTKHPKGSKAGQSMHFSTDKYMCRN